MSITKLNASLVADVAALKAGRPRQGPRTDHRWLRSCRRHARPALPAARQRPRVPADEQQQLSVAVESPGRCWRRPTSASHAFGAGPGAVRFIDGTFAPHARARGAHRPRSSVGRPRGSSTRPTRRCWVWRSRSPGPDTFWIGDELNHNCIIRAMRIANVPSAQRAILQAQRRRRSRAAPRRACPTAPGASS